MNKEIKRLMAKHSIALTRDFGTIQDMSLVHYADPDNGESLGLLIQMDDGTPDECFHVVSCDICEFTGDFGEWGVDIEGAILAAMDEDMFERTDADMEA